MAPIKFEENIKDKLEKRSLEPSADSWSKLSERLDIDEKKSKKPALWWLGIAASLAILITVSIAMLNKNNSETINPQVVEEQKDKVEETQQPAPKVILESTESTQLANETSPKVLKEKPMPNEKPLKTETKIRDYKKVITQNKKSNLAEAPKDTIEELKIATIIPEKKQSEIKTDQAIMKEAVANALQTLKSENTAVTDREIDSLLKIASKEIFKERLQQETSRTVDANALLESVEEDMGQSFRSKVFKALKESYETVKTAVAERND